MIEVTDECDVTTKDQMSNSNHIAEKEGILTKDRGSASTRSQIKSHWHFFDLQWRRVQVCSALKKTMFHRRHMIIMNRIKNLELIDIATKI